MTREDRFETHDRLTISPTSVTRLAHKRPHSRNMLFIGRTYAERLSIVFEVIIAIRHTESSLTHIDHILLTVFHVLINTNTPRATPTYFLKLGNGRDKRRHIFNFLNAVQPWLKRRKTACIALFHTKARSIEI